MKRTVLFFIVLFFTLQVNGSENRYKTIEIEENRSEKLGMEKAIDISDIEDKFIVNKELIAKNIKELIAPYELNGHLSCYMGNDKLLFTDYYSGKKYEKQSCFYKIIRQLGGYNNPYYYNRNNNIYLFDLKKKIIAKTFVGSKTNISSLCKVNDKQFVSSDYTSIIKTWNVDDGKHEETTFGNGDMVLQVCSFENDKTFIVSNKNNCNKLSILEKGNFKIIKNPEQNKNGYCNINTKLLNSKEFFVVGGNKAVFHSNNSGASFFNVTDNGNEVFVDLDENSFISGGCGSRLDPTKPYCSYQPFGKLCFWDKRKLNKPFEEITWNFPKSLISNKMIGAFLVDKNNLIVFTDRNNIDIVNLDSKKIQNVEKFKEKFVKGTTNLINSKNYNETWNVVKTENNRFITTDNKGNIKSYTILK